MTATPETYILFSLTADLSLCVVLALVWLRERGEWQALFWAGSQICISLGTVASHVWPEHGSRPALTTLALVLAVGGIWAGTAYLLGKARRRAARPALAVLLALWLAVYLFRLAFVEHFASFTAAALGGVMLWAGLTLARHRSYYRLLGFVLLVRGGFNLANAFGLLPAKFDLWFMYSVLIKTLTMLCVINAVQEKIRARYAHTLDSLMSGLLVLDQAGVAREVNRGALQLLGCQAPARIVGRALAEVIAGPILAVVRGQLARLDVPDWSPCPVATTTLVRADGRAIPVDVLSSRYDDGGRIHYMVHLHDVSERQRKDEQLYRSARYDRLTGALNRYGLLQALERPAAAVGTAGTSGTSGTCYALFINLDRFQRINDCFGQDTGDRLLKQVAGCLRQHLGPDDILARFGGDEFVVILRAPAPRPTAAALAARLLGALGAGLRLDHQTISLSASIGIAGPAAGGADAALLVNQAENAMHEAKRGGKGAARPFDPRLHANAKDALLIDVELRGAAGAGELRLLYQPVVDTGSLRIRKVEALLRWHSPLLGTVSPDRFIPIAEESGLIIEIGAWVLREACRQLTAWGDPLDAVTVSVNISPRQLTDPAFLGLIREVLSTHGIAAHRLELELTERVLIDDGTSARAVLEQLSAMGVRLALDDFGTGYSSLGYLSQFQLDTLKIDRSFVMDIERSGRSLDLVTAIVRMGQSLGLELVAEGVETAAQAAALEGLGCHYLQGYHIAKPLAPAELLRFVGSSRVGVGVD